MSHDENVSARKRERSTRYPGSTLAESVDLARFVADKGLDGLAAAEIASALGYKNVKTNTFSARLSGARQFGLLALKDDGYTLTPLARSILHPMDPAELPRLYRQALLEPPLYTDLANRLADKKVPDAAILANILYHHHQIIASAKDAAAEIFLESSRFAGVLGDDGIFRPSGRDEPASAPAPAAASAPNPTAPILSKPAAPAGERPSIVPGVRIDLKLWGADSGQTIRVRAPESITPESFERFLQAFRLHVRIEEPLD